MVLLKILLVPAIILLISVAGRVFGPAVSGLLGGLPVIAGPILLFLSFEHGSDFATRATLGALASVSSLAMFCLVYAHSSLKLHSAGALVMSISAFLLTTIVFRLTELSSVSGLALALVSIFAGELLMPNVTAPKLEYAIPNREIIFRMLAAAVLVLSITGASSLLGPQLSGLLAPFPVAGTVLGGFTHYHYGHAATVGLLKGFLRGLVGMAIFDFVLLTLTARYGFELAFAIAIICGLLSGAIVAKGLLVYTKLREGNRELRSTTGAAL
ncbi:MAG: hypothetical protein U0136_07545 [Bdellovibrionota bacterium]